MRWFFIAILTILGCLASIMAAQTGTSIQGGKVTIQGGYMAIGKPQTAFVVVTSTGGQPIGMLLGVTYSN